MGKQYLSLEQVSQRLHLAPGTVRNRLSRNDPMPPSIRVGRRRLFPEDKFEAWMESRVVIQDQAASE